METVIIAATAVLGLYMAWNIGANDFANAFADAVGSKAITIRWAIVLGILCEFAGSVLVGAHVTDTVRQGIVSPEHFRDAPATLALGMVCALLAASLWLHIATWLGMPVSTTHAIVGAVAGFGLVGTGWHAIEWHRLVSIVASWFISPVAGGVLGYLLFRLIARFVLARQDPAVASLRSTPAIAFAVVMVVSFSVFLKGGLEKRVPWLGGWTGLWVALGLSAAGAVAAGVLTARFMRGNVRRPLIEQLALVERVFAPLVVLTSCSIAFAHGANDVANAVGPLAAVSDIIRSRSIEMQPLVPLWILALGGVGIVLGLATFGYRVLRTIGSKITELTPSRGVAADLATCTTVLVCSRLKLPVSTTHTIVGAIVGVGLARGLGGINRRVIRHIFGSWLVTVPAAALVAVLLFGLGRLAHLDAWLQGLMNAGR